MFLHNSPYCRFELFHQLPSICHISSLDERGLTRVKTRPIFFSKTRNSASNDSFGFSAVNLARFDICSSALSSEMNELLEAYTLDLVPQLRVFPQHILLE